MEGCPDEVDRVGLNHARRSVDPVPIVRQVPGCAIPPTVPSHHRSTRRRCTAVSEFSSLRTSSPTIRSGCFPRTRLPAPATRWLRAAAGLCALGDSMCDHVSIDRDLRFEETVDTCHHSSDVARDRSASYEVEGFLLAEPRSGVRCSARGVTAGHQ